MDKVRRYMFVKGVVERIPEFQPVRFDVPVGKMVHEIVVIRGELQVNLL